MIKHELTARLADGTPAPNKLGDSVKTLKHTLSGLDGFGRVWLLQGK